MSATSPAACSACMAACREPCHVSDRMHGRSLRCCRCCGSSCMWVTVGEWWPRRTLPGRIACRGTRPFAATQLLGLLKWKRAAHGCCAWGVQVTGPLQTSKRCGLSLLGSPPAPSHSSQHLCSSRRRKTLIQHTGICAVETVAAAAVPLPSRNGRSRMRRNMQLRCACADVSRDMPPAD